MLDEFGVDYVEGGYPGANPTDTAFFAEKRTKTASFVAFGMTKRAGVSTSNDPGLALIQAESDAVCLSPRPGTTMCAWRSKTAPTRKTSSLHRTAVKAVTAGKEAMVDCEHFFDGYKANPAYALACAETAHEAGARWIVLCDTNGGTQPSRSRYHRRPRCSRNARRPAWHPCPQRHRQAVANSLAAVRAGVRQIQGTLNGIGERCGNANLTTLIPTLMLKPAFSDRFEIGHRAGKAGQADGDEPRLRRVAQPRARRNLPMSAPRLLPPRPASMPPRC
jgi:2-isopropylmalate synthase